MTVDVGYGDCPVCGNPIHADDWPHTWDEDGVSDIHEQCCGCLNDDDEPAR